MHGYFCMIAHEPQFMGLYIQNVSNCLSEESTIKEQRSLFHKVGGEPGSPPTHCPRPLFRSHRQWPSPWAPGMEIHKVPDSETCAVQPLLEQRPPWTVRIPSCQPCHIEKCPPGSFRGPQTRGPTTDPSVLTSFAQIYIRADSKPENMTEIYGASCISLI